MRHRRPGALVAVTLVLSGCGLKGPLYLPEKPGEVVIRPAPAAADPAATPPPSAAETPPPSAQPQDPPDGPERG